MIKWLKNKFSSSLNNIEAHSILLRALDENNLKLLEQAIEEQRGPTHSLIHEIMINGRSQEFIYQSLSLIKTKWDFNPKNNLNSKLYTPLASLFINNPSFYEKRLVKILPKLIPEFYSADELPKNLNQLHSYYWYSEGGLSKSEIINSITTEHPIPFINNLFSRNEIERASYPSIESYWDLNCNLITTKSFDEFTEHIMGKNCRSFRKYLFENVILEKHETNELLKGFSKIPVINFFATIIKDENKLLKTLNILENKNLFHYFQKSLDVYSLLKTKDPFDSFSFRNSGLFKIPMNLRFNLMRDTKPIHNQPNISLFSWFIEEKGVDKFIEFFIEKNSLIEIERDTVLMLKIVEDKLGEVNIKKYKNLKELHDFLSLETIKIASAPFDIPQPTLDHLENHPILNSTVFIPKTNTDVILGGSLLNICIGMDHYALGVKDKIHHIVFLKQNDKFYAAIHFNAYGIIEAKTSNNNQIPPEYLREFNKLINELEDLYCQENQNKP